MIRTYRRPAAARPGVAILAWRHDEHDRPTRSATPRRDAQATLRGWSTSIGRGASGAEAGRCWNGRSCRSAIATGSSSATASSTTSCTSTTRTGKSRRPRTAAKLILSRPRGLDAEWAGKPGAAHLSALFTLRVVADGEEPGACDDFHHRRRGGGLSRSALGSSRFYRCVERPNSFPRCSASHTNALGVRRRAAADLGPGAAMRARQGHRFAFAQEVIFERRREARVHHPTATPTWPDGSLPASRPGRGLRFVRPDRQRHRRGSAGRPIARNK